jgi:hypothetical protein
MDYAAALIEQNRVLGELLRDADWSVPVPTCPDWTLLQLLRHVGRGGRWAAGPLRSSPTGQTPAWTRGWLRTAGRPLTSRARSRGFRKAP